MLGFYQDDACELPPDGVSIITIPSSVGTVVDEVVSGGGYRKLAQENLILGSMTLVCDDSELCCDDWALAGHTQWPVGPPKPWIDHAAGLLKLPDPNKSWTVSYQYAAAPGRYIREQWGPGGSVTPSMAGGSIQWAATAAAKLGRPLHGEGERVRDVVEFQGTLSGSWKVPSQHVLDCFLPTAYTFGFETKLDRLLVRSMPCFVPVSGAKSVTLKDLTIDGCYAEAAWAAAQASPNWAQIDQHLRESPYGTGFAATSQSGRIPCPVVIVDNVTITGTASSCLLAHQDTRLVGSRLVLGPTTHGRTLYAEGPHDLTNVELNEFSLNSHYRGGPGVNIRGFRYRSTGLTNPGAGEYVQDGVAGLSNIRRDGWSEITGIDFDLRSSGMPVGISIGTSGIFSGTVRGGRVASHQNAKGSLNGRWNLEIVDGVQLKSQVVNGEKDEWYGGQPYTLAFVSGTGQAVWNNLDATITLRRVDTRSVLDPPVLGQPYDSTRNAKWNRVLDVAPEVRVTRNSTHPPGHTQNIRICVQSDWPTQTVLNIPDIATVPIDQCVPTTIYIHDSRIDEQFTTLVSATVGATQAVPTGLGAKPVRVVFDRCVLNIIKPQPWRGAAQDGQWEYITLKECHTPDGRLIDVEKIKDGSWWQ